MLVCMHHVWSSHAWLPAACCVQGVRRGEASEGAPRPAAIAHGMQPLPAQQARAVRPSSGGQAGAEGWDADADAGGRLPLVAGTRDGRGRGGAARALLLGGARRRRSGEDAERAEEAQSEGALSESEAQSESEAEADADMGVDSEGSPPRQQQVPAFGATPPAAGR